MQVERGTEEDAGKERDRGVVRDREGQGSIKGERGTEEYSEGKRHKVVAR
jgi:hypothetical protein